MERAIVEFLVESHEGLDRVEADLVALEDGSAGRDTIDRVFRAIHTMKGAAGFLGFARLEAVVHQGEGLLGLLRDGELKPDRKIANALLAMIDALRSLLAGIESSGGTEGSVDVAELVAMLARLQGKPGDPRGPGGPEPLTELEAAAPNLVERTVRVHVDLLDRLMNLVGELVLARNQIVQIAAAQHDSPFLAPSQRLNLLTTELQEGVMKTRLQPISTAWSKLPRLVRDVAQLVGKRVRLELDGKDTELDRTIIDAITAPLAHLVRNAVDHGIETAEVRAERGKPPEGQLSIRATHESGNVSLVISDDGAGIDTAVVAERAVARGLLTPDQAARLGPRELLQLVFRPGFSTAEKVTTVSGRGVGLDVVKTNVERVGGTVELESTRGQGTRVSIKIPLTLAIIPALVVTGREQRYAIPQASVLEVVRVDPKKGVETVVGAPVYRLRGKLLTLVDLDRELAPEDEGEPGEGALAASVPGSRGGYIVVLQADQRTFGLLVEGVSDTEEIVVKPLGRHLKETVIFAGATIMGDGVVALILDVRGLAQRARILADARERRVADAAVEASAARPRAPVGESLLLVEIDGGERAAIPLSLVARLEELDPASIERAGGQEMVQYRGQIMPLVRVAQVLGRPERARAPGTVPVIVYQHAEGSVGLAVDEIVDIVEEPATQRRPSHRPGIQCTSVVQQRVTEMLDLPRLVELAAAGRGGAS